jgi:triosephosphate isomerase
VRTKLVVGNWKMHKTVAEAAALVEGIVPVAEAHAEVDVALCPPFLALPKVFETVKRSHVKLGAQDCFWTDEGAFTGKVSPKMLSDFCVAFCIVGHSETRGRFGKVEVPDSTLGHFAETDETVNLKVKALLFYAITPILCVGETLAEREAGKTDAVIEGQLRGGLAGVSSDELYGLVVAYEPVWAIGTGQTCGPDEANRVCGLVRGALASLGGAEAAAEVRVLYGGSVKPENAFELFHRPEIDGGLVGGASLNADTFNRIIAAA